MWSVRRRCSGVRRWALHRGRVHVFAMSDRAPTASPMASTTGTRTILSPTMPPKTGASTSNTTEQPTRRYLQRRCGTTGSTITSQRGQ